METKQSIEIINQMLLESKKSLHRNSFYFILWGFLLIPAGVADYFLFETGNSWIGWPIMSVIGGIATAIYSRKEDKRSGTQTVGDRITLYTWGAFGFTLLFSIFFSVYNQISPYPLVLMLAGFATFVSGGISKFRPFILGGIALELGAITCAFFTDMPTHGLVFALSLILGYIIPGFLLKKTEHA